MRHLNLYRVSEWRASHPATAECVIRSLPNSRNARGRPPSSSAARFFRRRAERVRRAGAAEDEALLATRGEEATTAADEGKLSNGGDGTTAEEGELLGPGDVSWMGYISSGAGGTKEGVNAGASGFLECCVSVVNRRKNEDKMQG